MTRNVTQSSPPAFDEEKQTWKEYKKELIMWKSLTSLETKKQGPALYLSLTGKAKEIVKDLDSEEIIANDGIDTMTQAMEAFFKKDENQEAYITYKQFEEYKRPKSMTVRDFIIKFESLHSKLKSLKMELPEGVKGYRLLHSANLTKEENKLCLATIK